MSTQKDFFESLKNSNLFWQRHALEKLLERGISRTEVKEVLKAGELIEFYPDDFPLPSCLILGFPNRHPLHVVVAVNKNTKSAFVVTVYRPDTKHFYEDYKTRKQ